MANYTEIRFKKPVPWKKINNVILNVLTGKFYDHFFTLNEKKNGTKVIGFFDKVLRRSYSDPHVEYHIIGSDKAIKSLRMSDNRTDQTDAGWFAAWLTSKIADAFKAKIFYGSLGKIDDRKFHIDFPTMYSWNVKKRYGFVMKAIAKLANRGRLKELKKLLPANVYKVFAEKK